MDRRSQREAEAIRRRVLAALAADRTPGFHFPGHFLACAWPRIGTEELDQVLPDGPHARNVDGTVHLAALCVLLDTALATASRLKIERGARQATVHLHAQFTGEPPRGELLARARMHGYTCGAAARQSLTSATVYAGNAAVCRASGTFVVLPPPPGVNLAPLPWQRQGATPAPPLDPEDLEPDERSIMKACESALKRADRERAFIEHFWGILPVADGRGARCTVRIGPQHANRVGHVQGGLLLGIAAQTARAAAPRHPQLSAVAAWYIAPGEGRALAVSARRFHEGRSFAAVRTEIRNAGGSRVLVAVSHHAA
ncbi:MAG TPA: acyl-CoA thioesterase domain-containing protein [Burkholderiales bacterium]|nr:acyl-CoA thioesterase domain-containing protein [Burkholderiales bacterium]